MAIENYAKWFAGKTTAEGMESRYVTVYILRALQSEAIFRTDEGKINTERTKAGILRNDDDDAFWRVFMSKRKGVAPERRTGRGLLRKFGLLKKGAKGETCKINETMCGACIDCKLYGSAIGTDTSNRSRVVTDEGLSLLPSSKIVTEHTFNSIAEDNASIGNNGQGLGKDQVVRMGSHILDIETFADISMDAFAYLLGNILRTERYGAMTTRMGKTTNVILGISFSNCEMFSNLEWVQSTYDEICRVLKVPDGEIPNFPLDAEVAKTAAKTTLATLAQNMSGSVKLLDENETASVLQQIRGIYEDENVIRPILERLDAEIKS